MLLPLAGVYQMNILASSWAIVVESQHVFILKVCYFFGSPQSFSPLSCVSLRTAFARQSIWCYSLEFATDETRVLSTPLVFVGKQTRPR